MRLPHVFIAAIAVGTIVACHPANAANTIAGPANRVGGVVPDHASAPLGTVSISLRGGTQTISLVVSRSGELLPWSQFTETPYIAEVIAGTGKKPVSVQKIFRDGVWEAVGATVDANHRVELDIDLKDTSLVKMDHSTFATLGTIDRPEWKRIELHQIVNLGSGEAASLGSSEKPVATVSWTSL
ncbi:MAG: hypothetical protein ABF479_10545 [Gluconacetobacter sp.]